MKFVLPLLNESLLISPHICILDSSEFMKCLSDLRSLVDANRNVIPKYFETFEIGLGYHDHYSAGVHNQY